MTLQTETPPRARAGLQSLVSFDRRQNLGVSKTYPEFQVSIVTAIPCGKRWRVKIVGKRGETALVGEPQCDRLHALGLAVLFANHIGGEVRP